MKLAITSKPFQKGFTAIVFFIIAAMLGVIQSCSLFEDQPQKVEKPPEEQTLVWKVKQNRLSKPVYLMADAYPNIRSYLSHGLLFNKCITKADTFLTPFDKPRSEVYQTLAANTKMQGGITLDSFLNPKAQAALKQTLNKLRNMSYSDIKNAPPLAVAEVVIPAIGDAATNPTYARKAWTLREKAYKPALGVLDPELLKQGYQQISLKSQAQTLKKVLNQKEAIKKGLRKMARAYARPNYAELAKARDQVYAYPKRYDSTIGRTVTNAWVKAIQHFEGTNPLLAVVEAQHLKGKDGVINQLRQSGYEVETYNPKRFPNADKHQQGTN
jgi:uncharacterized protein YbaP (TraB family)